MQHPDHGPMESRKRQKFVESSIEVQSYDEAEALAPSAGPRNMHDATQMRNLLAELEVSKPACFPIAI